VPHGFTCVRFAEDLLKQVILWRRQWRLHAEVDFPTRCSTAPEMRAACVVEYVVSRDLSTINIQAIHKYSCCEWSVGLRRLNGLEPKSGRLRTFKSQVRTQQLERPSKLFKRSSMAVRIKLRSTHPLSIGWYWKEIAYFTGEKLRGNGETNSRTKEDRSHRCPYNMSAAPSYAQARTSTLLSHRGRLVQLQIPP